MSPGHRAEGGMPAAPLFLRPQGGAAPAQSEKLNFVDRFAENGKMQGSFDSIRDSAFEVRVAL